MKAEDQRIAIATLCGWRDFHTASLWIEDGESDGFRLMLCGVNDKTSVSIVPDYGNDLNAAHEAEKVLGDEQFDRFVSDLWSIVAPSERFERAAPIRFLRAYTSATAEQRAEAILRALGKYTDAPSTPPTLPR